VVVVQAVVNPVLAWPSVGTRHGLDDSNNGGGDEKGRQRLTCINVTCVTGWIINHIAFS